MRTLRARGQAALELSLLLIVLVPIIFYSLFLDDLLRHRVDLLEGVVSSPWDFAGIDQQANKGFNMAQTERHAWCDHTYAYNSYDIDYECDSDPNNSNAGAGRHHKAFTAHVCFVVQGGQQIQCETDEGTGKIDDNASYNGGGVTTCSARAGVFNYFIVNQAMEGFTNMDNLTKAEHMSGEVHSHYGAASANIFMLEKQQFAILHDDWAMKTPDNVDALFDIMPSFGDSTFKGRVAIYYDKFAKFDEADDFFEKLTDEDLIDDGADDDGLGDDPSTLHMSFNSTPGNGFGLITKHTSSAWSDQRVQDTHSAREDSYFGLPESTW
ncbi:MAG: hypothetical protein H6Q89_563 [Myxococcaceae bacterium]|nr:hypothetical protein [Myxococcaceae bacterium]